ncbi:MAG: prepilin-type N-terminal cleavage/methylation protein [Microbacteriaceae bacterium]|jgi:type IV pilus assembly protein PilA|nr:prepilin-type N-terminal cleavage/methylation protein [Microbacteriaceae bacterium]
MITALTSALRNKRDSIEKDDTGFTLIELLVVVLIIGILAAIAIPVFLGQQNQAKDATAQSDLANAKVAVVSYMLQNPTATGISSSDLKTYGYTPSISGNPVSGLLGTSGAFCIQVTSASGSTHTYALTDSTPAVKGTCSSATAISTLSW